MSILGKIIDKYKEKIDLLVDLVVSKGTIHTSELEIILPITSN